MKSLFVPLDIAYAITLYIYGTNIYKNYYAMLIRFYVICIACLPWHMLHDTDFIFPLFQFIFHSHSGLP
jgi:hypothetical protein